MGGAWLKSMIVAATLLAGLSSGAGLRPSSFSFLGVSNRIITPNGDGKNATVTFRFDNSQDSAGSVKIYDLNGHVLTTISIDAGLQSVVWDPGSSGRAVAAGVYVYVISIEQTAISGTVAVVR